jgi:predicted aspartyl protease
MRSKGGNGAGRFSVHFEVVNGEDLVRAKDGTLPKNRVRRRTITGVVECGAAMLVLPGDVVKDLGLPLGDEVRVRYADGRRAKRREALSVYLELLGRHTTLPAVIEPKRKDALIGAIVLEALDLLVDSKNQRLIPRDPTGVMFEIE